MSQDNGTPETVAPRSTVGPGADGVNRANIKGNGPTGQTRIVLTILQNFQLMTYVSTQRDRLETMDLDAVVRECQEKMRAESSPFEVGKSNVIRTFRDLGIVAPKRKRKNAGGVRGMARINARLGDHDDAIRRVSGEVDTLAGLVASLETIGKATVDEVTRLQEHKADIRAIQQALLLLASGMKRAANRYPELRPFFESAGTLKSGS